MLGKSLVKRSLQSTVKRTAVIDPLHDQHRFNELWEFDHVESDLEHQFLTELQSSSISFDSKAAAHAMLRSEALDLFMSKRFGQVKRYGLEGGEGLMVALKEVLSRIKHQTVVIGMSHRGRLNVMAGLLGYPLEALLAKVRGVRELPESIPGSGDVLSHLWLDNRSGEKRCILLPNPSHLEAINPVHLGVVHCLDPLQACSLQIHGDGAFAGQGVVQESLMLSRLPGFSVNGTIHIVVNNQLGFTADACKSRSTRYPTDPCKMLSVPVFHVSGDNPESICKAADAAVRYKQQFSKDVAIDLVCYRRMGHNELDEPAFTQPVMYKQIRSRPLPGTLFAQGLQMVSMQVLHVHRMLMESSKSTIMS